jgi:hypothetical protein
VFGVKAGIYREDIDRYIARTSIIKIMVTYDSIDKVEHLLDRCKLVIDESQELLKGQKLKSTGKVDIMDIDANNNLLNIAYKYRDRLSMISATPIPLEYMPEWVSELDQVKLLWEGGRKVVPMLMKRSYPLSGLMKEIILPIKKNGSVVLANETITKVVVFINSVTDIARILKDCGLKTSKDIGVIVGSSLTTKLKLKNIPRVVNPYKLPTFTFVTSAGFKGIDLYDKEAVSIVVSKVSKNFTMLDLDVDIVQAVSRIRNKDNKFSGRYIYIYNKKLDDISKEELQEGVDRTKKSVLSQIRSWDLNREANNEDGFRCDNVFSTYSLYEPETKQFCLNKNLFEADRYFIEQIHEKYLKGFKILSYLGGESLECVKEINKVTYKDVAKEYIRSGSFSKYSAYTEYKELVKRSEIELGKVYLDYRYVQTKLDNKHKDYKYYKNKIKRMFKKGNRYPAKQIKNKLQMFYDKEGIDKKANATDLKEIMDIKYIVTNKTRMIEIL